MDLLRAARDRDPPYHRPDGHDVLRSDQGQPGTRLSRTVDAVSRDRAAGSGCQARHQTGQGNEIFPQGPVRQLEERRSAADVRNDRLDVSVLFRLSQSCVFRRKASMGCGLHAQGPAKRSF